MTEQGRKGEIGKKGWGGQEEECWEEEVREGGDLGRRERVHEKGSPSPALPSPWRAE